ncbi:MAG: heme-copper oxidase subunit III [Aureliella sp.]
MPTVKPAAEDRRSAQGAWLFIGSLAVFFFSSIFLYAIYVLLRIAPQSGEIQPFYLPRSFLLTTVNLVAISILLHLALTAIRSEKRVDFVRYVVLASILAAVFFGCQGTALTWMIQEMQRPGPAMQNLYGFTFFLVIVHALHVVGGVAGLVFLLFGVARQAYDHERHFPVRFCALYWHFLDAVWIVMMLSFGLAAYVSKLPS